MPQLGLGLSIAKNRSSGFSPKKISGLSMWLKADAGTITTQDSFITQIVISGAGESTSNGTYTRTEGGENQFSGPNGNVIYFATPFWYLYDNSLLVNTYVNSSFTFDSNWQIEEAADPAPSASYTTSTFYYVQTWEDQSGNNFNAYPWDYAPILNQDDLNGKPTISLTSLVDYNEKVFQIDGNPLGLTGSTAFSVQYVENVCDIQPGPDEPDINGPIFGNFGLASDGSHYPYGLTCTIYDSFATTTRKNNITPPATITEAWSLYSVKSTNGDWQSFVNGQLAYSDPSNVYSRLLGAEEGGIAFIGKQTMGGGNYPIKGKVAEAIIYNRVLTTEERQKVEAYLNTKYALY